MKKTKSATAKRKNKLRRISTNQYYLNIAREVAKRSTCLRRKYGAVIVKNKQIISTGYCGAPRETQNCCDVGTCTRRELHAEHGHQYELCRAVHAEQNAIISASRLDMLKSTLYLVGMHVKDEEMIYNAGPCQICKRIIINAGITSIVIQASKKRIKKIKIGEEWIKSNLGELRKVKGKWKPILPKGY